MCAYDALMAGLAMLRAGVLRMTKAFPESSDGQANWDRGRFRAAPDGAEF
jgi:hypothetical protein